MISDFHDVGYLPTMRRVNRRHDVVGALIKDTGEASLPASGLVVLRDAETGAERLIDAGDKGFRSDLLHLANARIERLRSGLQASGIDLMVLDTHEPALNPLLGFLRMREKRVRR